jgi:hypothetical protein
MKDLLKVRYGLAPTNTTIMIVEKTNTYGNSASTMAAESDG